jgi:pimeloyl-ACP methyl ester carboxylesterase
MADEIAVEIHGNGDPVVMVHGLGGTSNVFGPQADVLSRYFRVIRPDLPGSGRSRATGALSIESLVETVIGVMDRNNARPAHLVGHSMGTIVCQHLAVKYPMLFEAWR